MELGFFLRGVLIGFSIAAPVGSIGVLCIRRTLAEGRINGFISGLGAASADAIYGCIAGFGLTFISSFLISVQVGLRLIGGIFFCYLGVTTFLSKPAKEAAFAKGSNLMSAYFSMLVLTLTNPVTILSFAAVFAGLGIASMGNYISAGILVLGVFIGSALWWLLLSGGVSLFRDKFTSSRLVWINRIAGIIITAFGILALLHFS